MASVSLNIQRNFGVFAAWIGQTWHCSLNTLVFFMIKVNYFCCLCPAAIVCIALPVCDFSHIPPLLGRLQPGVWSA